MADTKELQTLDEPSLKGLEARIKIARKRPVSGYGVVVGPDLLEALVAAARRDFGNSKRK